jgi:two-component system alkaline phosphatase synthesis response regulator PhoP
MKVLVIEDEQDIREFLVSQFQEAGHESIGLENGDNVLQNLQDFHPNIILLDQIMPGKSGTQIIKEVRSNAIYSETPIMMITGLDGENEKVRAFNTGADDYVTKPFSIMEVVARANALFRRSQTTHKAQQKNIVMEDLNIDLNSHKVIYRGQEISLTLTEFKILSELIQQSGQVLTRDRLREKALGNLNVTDRTIDVHMASLRKKLSDMGDRIETVRGVGYRLN